MSIEGKEISLLFTTKNIIPYFNQFVKEELMEFLAMLIGSAGLIFFLTEEYVIGCIVVAVGAIVYGISELGDV